MFFNGNTPAYKSVASGSVSTQPAATNGLSGLIGSVVGRKTLAYKTLDGQSLQAPVSSGFWSMFGSSPPYKTPPTSNDASCDVDACDPGVVDNDVCSPGPDEIVVL